MKNESRPAADEPITLFKEWLKEADVMEPNNPNACALATADKFAKPSVRMVLLKQVDERGFIFYTNSESQKGLELLENPEASLCFYWKSLGREVRIDGHVESITKEESDKYFASRARDSQIGAWASKQSRELESRSELEKRVVEFSEKFRNIKVPRPKFWEGYLVKHKKVEFWSEKKSRLHERLVYIWSDRGWLTKKLYP